MGIIFDIQRCCYHDGPGIRTTVFLKGCNLRCAWCHNPESFSARPQLKFISRRCTICQACAGVCPQGVHTFRDGAHRVDFARCIACGACSAVCPAGALTMVGREMSVREVMDAVLRDMPYYRSTGGGVTFSGGEPTFQRDFLPELLAAANAAGIHTALETNGFIPQNVLEKVLPLTDLFLLDFKLTEAEGLRENTLAHGDTWDRTLRALTDANVPVILRMPVIPGINDTPSHFAQAVGLQRAHPNIQKIEIMPYHAIGADKWEELGLTYTLKELPTVSPEQAALWQQLLDEAMGN